MEKARYLPWTANVAQNVHRRFLLSCQQLGDERTCGGVGSSNAAIRQSLSKRLDHSSAALICSGASTAGKYGSPSYTTQAEVKADCLGKLFMWWIALAAKS